MQIRPLILRIRDIKISYSNVNDISYFNNMRYKNGIKNEI